MYPLGVQPFLPIPHSYLWETVGLEAKKPSIPNRQPSLTLCLSRQINGEPFWALAFTCSKFQSSFIHTLPWTHLFVSDVCPMALVKSPPLYSVLREDGQCPPFPIFLRWQGFLHHGVWG